MPSPTCHVCQRDECVITARYNEANVSHLATHIVDLLYDTNGANLPRKAGIRVLCAGKAAPDPPGLQKQHVKAYLERNGLYCGPCLFHDPPRMIMLPISGTEQQIGSVEQVSSRNSVITGSHKNKSLLTSAVTILWRSLAKDKPDCNCHLYQLHKGAFGCSKI